MVLVLGTLYSVTHWEIYSVPFKKEIYYSFLLKYVFNLGNIRIKRKENTPVHHSWQTRFPVQSLVLCF